MESLKTKRRILVDQHYNWSYLYLPTGAHYSGRTDLPHGYSTGSKDSVQITESRGNSGWQAPNGVDVGGPFRTRKFFYTKVGSNEPLLLDDIFPVLDFYLESWPHRSNCRAAMFHVPIALHDLFPFFDEREPGLVPGPSTKPNLEAFGTKYVEACKPTKTANSLYVSLKELKTDGLPRILGLSAWKEKTRILRGVGSEYLNTQYGWIPLIADIQRYASTVGRFEAIWSQYVRDAGRLVRRSYRPEPELNTVRDNPSYPYFGGEWADYSASATGRLMTRTRSIMVERWFTGAFRYYLPDRESKSQLLQLRRHLSKLNKLLGIVPTPDMIWSATPWTWAADWFSNVGSVVSNLSDTLTDSLVMPYGYVMERNTQETEIRSTGGLLRTGPTTWSPMPSMSLKVVDETKQRIQASPYGFGLTWEGFTPTQLSILAALGITRGR